MIIFVVIIINIINIRIIAPIAGNDISKVIVVI